MLPRRVTKFIQVP